ncbi:glucose-6-phosphate isomerase [Spiroplasma citri]|uniref:Glucose-6-phosphate isomerase n=1 Tax=Spiroplasma citri TaxID=2133 RepID=Q14PM8_SPICI|nr:glucose-6-phosphate isomerase [Spiroplasma citri]APE74225.1 glucose-6-phosphate isomerase [Spiroplasma citri]QED24193.1 glucose-6-phosphate isomerase [Spiroplasma citri]QIA66458.1 glucose-6-phosphate isomerase [Spiroplasma citri]QIA68336.1 glucose-6-phosphate isomerase [Spiroplasma citri]QIA70213.1 glucose-6-phosphate isomerase [Spiroplasma citri]
MIKVDFTNALAESVFNKYLGRVKDIHQMIHNKTGLWNDFLGWVEWPNNYDQAELAKMKQTAKQLASEIDVLLVIGIGGSYLGARAAIEMINGLYSQQKVEIIYIGNTMSSTYTAQVLKYLQDKKFGICVVSKSGTTTEPAIAFRLCKELLEKKEGNLKAANLIVAITDKQKGALKTLADKAGYQTFVIPDDIGGRYSVLTPVGVFAMLVSGINIDNVFKGAQQAYQDTLIDDFTNHSYKYAVGRYILNQEEKYKAEMLVTYELQMQMITEWWKQLFGESEGKNSKGLLPLSCVFSTDLHSLGQFIQEGTKNILFETVIAIKKAQIDLKLSKAEVDTDGLNYLSGKTLHEVNTIAVQGVVAAHRKVGHVPNIVLEFATMDDKMFGYLSYWFMKACAMSAYLLEINPFDQPGVEIYKQNMFNLLGK